MLQPPEPSQELVEWLSSLHLSHYTSCFQKGGYQALEDCKNLTDERLLELQVLPTGHRRRILRSLEALGLKPQSGGEDGEDGEEQRKPVPYPRYIFLKDKKRGISCQHPQPKEKMGCNLEGSQTLPPGAGLGLEIEDITGSRHVRPPQPAPRNPQNIQTTLPEHTTYIPPSVSSSSSSESLSISEMPSDWEISPDCPTFSSTHSVPGPVEVPQPTMTEDHGGFHGEMVENSIYEAQPSINPARGPRLTRSYRLRHRPVPEIPNPTIPLLQDRSNTPKQKQPKERVSPPAPTSSDPYKDEYSTVDECASVLPRAILDQSLDRGLIMALPDISPYACFYGAPKNPVLKVGWLDKLSPQGKCMFQRRWVRFDGNSLAYYNNDKEMYSKGMILASAIRQVRGLGDNKFEVITSLRTFIFRAEKEGERQEWMETLQTTTRPPSCGSQKRSDSLSHLFSTNKRGLLELRSYKGRVLVSLAGSKVRLCKTEQDYKAGLAITEVELTAANIRDVDRRSFEINTPFKNFCFTAESEREKEEWIEAVQESIAETLSDYEVAEKIWFNKANRTCADCHAAQPEWASVNLGVVICKKCAGHHRSLGPSVSKVRSLKLDSSIWSNELVELFLEVGNKNANGFWAANLPMEEDLYSGATAEQRATFIRRKYRERKYRKVLEGFHDMEQLNQALCAAVVTPDVLRTFALVFSGANVMCATGDPAYSTPYLLAQRAGQKLQMEFLHQNKLTGRQLRVPSSSATSVNLATCLQVTLIDFRTNWTTESCYEGGFLSYYENERSSSPIGRVDVTEVVSLAISNTETMTGAGAVFTVELYLQTERVLIVGAETQETQNDWIHSLTKVTQFAYSLIGILYYKEGHDLYHWRKGWFMLEGSALHIISRGEEEVEVLQLKQLQELTVSTHTEGEDKIQVLLMVEGRRTVYIHGFNKMDFTLWHSAITLAAGTDGKALSDQQLTKNGVPIIVDSCIAFVTQYGLCHEGVYQKPGNPGRVAQLLEEFTHNARNVKLREKEHHLEDVTDTLKSFLSQAEDALLTKELYPYWVSVLDEKDERQRVKMYSTFIQNLPKINRSTLDALLRHLYRIQQCSHLNHMPSEKLASVFSSCLFQTRGQTPQEISVVRDLISNYVPLFSVNEDQVQQMERENSFITRWNDKKDTTVSEPSFCCWPQCACICLLYLRQVSPSMRSSELVESALTMRNVTFTADDCWTIFEVIENGELGKRVFLQSQCCLKSQSVNLCFLCFLCFSNLCFFILKNDTILFLHSSKIRSNEQSKNIFSIPTVDHCIGCCGWFKCSSRVRTTCPCSQELNSLNNTEPEVPPGLFLELLFQVN
uniref:ArfGAP with RhoGAP domain, ankyrin repeat and PH domain 2 n=1 Tax=Anabas testudineus TaxID=64144 RepID=A0A7N6BWY1_ANATE